MVTPKDTVEDTYRRYPKIMAALAESEARPAMQVTDAMVEAAYTKVRRMTASVDTADGDLETIIRAALTVALAKSAEPVGVKALEWRPVTEGGRDRKAATTFGPVYTISVDDPAVGGTCYLWCPLSDDNDYSTHASMREAKAAAQADFARRIRSALAEPAGEPVATSTVQISPADAKIIKDVLEEFYHKQELSPEEERAFLTLCGRGGFGRPVRLNTPPAAVQPERAVEALRKIKHWAQSKCPVHEETPDPCPLCGATVEKGVCKAVESIFPSDLLREVNAALAKEGR